MKIDLRNLGDSPSTIQAKYCREDSLNSYEGVVLKSDLMGEFSICRSGADGYLINGTVSGVQEFECSRTLEKFEKSFSVSVKVMAKKNKEVDDTELDDENEEIYNISFNPLEEEVDISECIRQQIVLSQPINPVKNPDKDFSWAGDSEPKEEEKSGVDSRWSELEKLKEKFKKDNP